MRTVLVLSTLAGCGSSVGAPCEGPADCDDSVCDLSNPDGAVCIARDGDVDGDGIPNAMDFCQHQAGGKFDEDQDGLGDECDSCPIAKPLETKDADGDAVESPCDPDPMVPGDAIVVFEGFNAGSPAGWRVEGPWEFRGGEVVIATPDPVSVSSLVAPLPLSSRHVAVLGQYRIDRVDTAAAQSRAGVTAVDRRPAGTTLITCSGQRSGAFDSLLLDTTSSISSRPFTTDLFDPAGRYRVATRIDNARSQCGLISDKETGAVEDSTNGETMTEAGLAARGATVRFQYLLVTQRMD